MFPYIESCLTNHKLRHLINIPHYKYKRQTNKGLVMFLCSFVAINEKQLINRYLHQIKLILLSAGCDYLLMKTWLILGSNPGSWLCRKLILISIILFCHSQRKGISVRYQWLARIAWLLNLNVDGTRTSDTEITRNDGWSFFCELH